MNYMEMYCMFISYLNTQGTAQKFGVSKIVFILSFRN